MKKRACPNPGVCQVEVAACELCVRNVCGCAFTPVSPSAGEYVNFVTISIWDETFGFILALVVFFATLKFIKVSSRSQRSDIKVTEVESRPMGSRQHNQNLFFSRSSRYR